MIDGLSDLDVDVPKINQISIVVEDLEDAMQRFSMLLGIDAYRVYHLYGDSHTDRYYKGEPADYTMDLALAAEETDDGIELWRETRTEIEIIAPRSGESAYTDHLEEHGEGIHHVACWDFEDCREELAKFEEAGFEVLQRGLAFDQTEYVYVDTRDELNGVLFELDIGGVEGREDPLDTPYAENVVVDDYF
jgi:hypothetical protein